MLGLIFKTVVMALAFSIVDTAIQMIRDYREYRNYQRNYQNYQGAT